jgi:hypothetical protein
MLGVETEHLYEHTRSRGRRGRLWSALTGRSRRLFALAEVDDHCTVRERCNDGVRAVPIDQIRGSEGRSKDFDRDFCPLQDHTRQRWLSVARARRQGKALPPVQLVQVGEIYFCLDGHHRISVARTLGQCYIEARVTVWRVSGTLPWERSAALPGPSSQETEHKPLYQRVKAGINQLQARTALNLPGPLSLLGRT